MITHVVIFWVDKPAQDNRDRLLAATRSLAAIPGVLNFRTGIAVPSPRAVVDDSFAVGISMDFQSAGDLATYQTHPEHLAFVRDYAKPLSSRFVVYDFQAP